MTTLPLALAMLVSAEAATIRVPDNQPTAQQAVNVAANGDIIEFTQPGNPFGPEENFTVDGKTLTFTAQNIGDGYYGTMSVVNGANVTIEGMELSGGVEEEDGTLIALGFFCAGLIDSAVVVEDSTLTVVDSSFKCYFDSAIKGVDPLQVTVTDSEFKFNYLGSAIAQTGGDLTIDNSIFEFNGAAGQFPPRGGGGVYADVATLEVTGSDFYANSTSGNAGGGMEFAADVATISGNDFSGNYNLIWFIPGVIIDDPNDLLDAVQSGALIQGLGDGGGLYVREPISGTTTRNFIHDNLFCGNLADSGAGLYVDDVEGIEIRNNRFADNWSLHYGAGLFIRATEAWDDANSAKVTNNTIVHNTAGILPPPYLPILTVYGGGGGAAFDGTVVDFRNNIVAYQPFGAGVLGVDGPDYTIGDLLVLDYNIMFWNCDVTGCAIEDPAAWQHFSGDMDQVALPATNLELDPFPVYFGGGGGDFNCFPDAFYPEWTSPAVRNGDVTLPNFYSPDFSDIGSYGGPDANVLDRDLDGFENIYDCNDEPDEGGALVFPGAVEQCDFLDNDCDGVIDEGFDTLWYPDEDADGYGDTTFELPVESCYPVPDHATNRDDCDDADPSIHAGAAELCDGEDNDCDFIPDSNIAFIPLWRDNDFDTYGGSLGEQVNGCSAQDPTGAPSGPGIYWLSSATGDPIQVTSGYVENNLDCNDNNPSVYPLAEEVCDGADNDCDGVSDNSSSDGTQFYPDGDGDGYGAGAGEYYCVAPYGSYAERGGDCEDFDPTINPGAGEVCDGIDNDCSGTTDRDAADATLLYEDLDQDGYGNDATAVRDCNPGESYTAQIGGDCDDNDPLIKECNTCGCQATPTAASGGVLAGLFTLLFGLRRRR